MTKKSKRNKSKSKKNSYIQDGQSVKSLETSTVGKMEPSTMATTTIREEGIVIATPVSGGSIGAGIEGIFEQMSLTPTLDVQACLYMASLFQCGTKRIGPVQIYNSRQNF